MRLCMYDVHLCYFKVLGIPWDVDTEGLREYMSKFGELEDCVVMKVSKEICFYCIILV